MKSKQSFLWIAAVLLVSAGCGGGPTPAQLGYQAVRQSMKALGHEPALPLTRMKIASGGSQSIPLRLQRGECTLLVAVAEGSVKDLRLTVLDPDGDIAASENAYDASASVQLCARREGDYLALLEADGGRAEVFFSGYQTSGSLAGASRPSGASCERTDGRLTPGTRVLGELKPSDPSGLTAGCAPTPGPEQIFEFELTERMDVTIELESAFDGVLYLRTGCSTGDELACNDDWGEVGRSRVSLPLDPGIYYAVVDGYDAAVGEFAITLRVSPERSPAEICADAEILSLGQVVRSNITEGTARFNASCAGGAAGPEEVRRLRLPERRRVRIEQRSDFDGVLYLRTVCDHATSELICNDDYMGVHTSVVVAQLDPGEYFVVSDTYMPAPNMVGEYLLSVEHTSPEGEGIEGDSCTNAARLPLGESIELDTFDARDDFASRCGGEGSPDAVYSFEVTERSRLRLTVSESQFAGRVSIRKACGDATSEVECAEFPMADMSQNAERRYDWILDRGTYSLVVDGADAGSFGKVKLEAELASWAALDRGCRNAPLLRPGRAVQGTTEGLPDEHRASCAGGAQSGDQVYRIQLSRPGTVEISLRAEYDGALHLRRDCLDLRSEIACNDDDGPPMHSRIVQQLDRGTYYVIVDGFYRGSAGAYELLYDLR